MVGSVYRASRHPGGQAAHDGRHLGFCGPRDPSRENGASDPAGGSCANGIAGGCTSRKRGRPVGTEAVRESVPARFAQAGFVRCAKAHRAKVAPPAIRAPRLRQKVSGRPRIGVTNPGDEQSSPGGARGGESRIGPLNQRRSADHVASPRRGGEATREGRSRGKPRGMPERGSGDRGGARGSWRLQASVLGALHRHAKASGRGTRIEARRSDSSRSTSFDEAAVQAGLALPQKERDRERQRLASDRPVGRIRPRRGRAARKVLDRAPTGPSRAGPEGNQRTSRVRPKLEDRRQAGLHPRSRRSRGFRPSGLNLSKR